MKAWRNRPELKQRVKADGTHIRGQRYGKLYRDTYTRIIPASTFLVQGLMIRIGLMKAG
jgi:hypothetical protein